ncbi:heme oxygenase (biliverdin-producing) [Rhodoplanes azumiensis]|uniref:Heme oxygenase (Biliverdin-producing) n=1 Tax=Rhodoplanes azumiensis TaxID=1897628 RepID=A0ABW5API4_9BRAD
MTQRSDVAAGAPSGDRDATADAAPPTAAPAPPSTPPSADEIRRIGLSSALREVTAPLHRQAEKAGAISDIVRGRSSRAAYALLLRNLHAVYEAIERGLDRHRDSPAVRHIVRDEVFRAGAIALDLENLCGGTAAAAAVPLLPEGRAYAAAVAEAAAGDGVGLIGHAYTRYLGDLSGGQTVSQVLARTLGLDAGMRNIYRFAGIGDLDAYKNGYRAAIDRAAFETERPDTILAEAMRAFRLNIALFWAVQAAADGTATRAGAPVPVA